MEQQSAAETAEKISRRRARMMPIFGVLFIGWQANYLSMAEHSTRLVDHVKISAWFVWALALLFLLAGGDGLFRSPEVRALLNDELTRENRRTGYVYGFWAAVGAAIGLYAIGLLEPLNGREAVHIMLTAAVGTALVTFGALERRQMRHG
jgi:MFS family permease